MLRPIPACSLIGCLVVLGTAIAAPMGKPRLDINGDPLPDGAIARIGSPRAHLGACHFAVVGYYQGKEGLPGDERALRARKGLPSVRHSGAHPVPTRAVHSAAL